MFGGQEQGTGKLRISLFKAKKRKKMEKMGLSIDALRSARNYHLFSLFIIFIIFENLHHANQFVYLYHDIPRYYW